jgi:hypothetical protein
MQDAAMESLEQQSNGIQMYILGNRNFLNGAVQMLNKGMLRTIGEEIGNDFFILPSSIHETILTPVRGIPDEADYLAQMVQQINDTQVGVTEQLSNHVYRYDCRTEQIAIAA